MNYVASDGATSEGQAQIQDCKKGVDTFILAQKRHSDVDHYSTHSLHSIF